jgi:hypothetical protein
MAAAGRDHGGAIRLSSLSSTWPPRSHAAGGLGSAGLLCGTCYLHAQRRRQQQPPTMERAAPALVVEDRQGRGRCAIAGRAFSAGEVILAESPLAQVLHHSQWGRRCNGCLQTTWETGHRADAATLLRPCRRAAPGRAALRASASDSCPLVCAASPADTVYRCGGCERYLYCSQACAEADWQRGHRPECAVLRRLPDTIQPDTVELLLLARCVHGSRARSPT